MNSSWRIFAPSGVSTKVGDLQAALESIRKTRAVTRLPEVIGCLRVRDVALRWYATETLAVFAGPRPPANLLTHLSVAVKDPNDLVRAVAVEALGRIRGTGTLVLLRRILGADRSWVVRASAAEALASLSDPRALSALRAALKDVKAPVRGYAARSIGLLAPRSERYVRSLKRAASAEANLGTQCELLASAYRLGLREELRNLCALAERVDETSINNWLNVVRELLTVKRPRHLTRDEPILAASLDVAASRFPELEAAVAAVRHSLRGVRYQRY